MKSFLQLSILLSFALVSCSQNNPAAIATADNSGSIIGGEKALPEDPVRASTVALMTLSHNKLTVFCSGTLISKNLVVTAAHCFSDRGDEKFYVFFGETLPTSMDDPHLIQIESAIYHQYYQVIPNQDKTGATIVNDIGLVRLSVDAPEGFDPAAILTTSRTLVKDMQLTVAGYGVVNESPRESATTLNYAKVPFVGLVEKYLILDQSDNKGVCVGDSGGPAYLETSKGLVLLGATNGIYQQVDDCHHMTQITDVTKYRRFILAVAKKLQAHLPTYIVPHELN